LDQTSRYAAVESSEEHINIASPLAAQSEEVMKTLLKSMAYAAILIPALATIVPQQAIAAGQIVREGEGIVTQLGAHVSAVTYWVAGPKSWDVVTTIDPLVGDEAVNDGRAILRFSSQLLPGQSQTISIPAVKGAQLPLLLIRRVTDSIEVETAPTLSD
jgi:hypothetical protein